MTNNIEHLRQEYGEAGLEPEDLSPDPIIQFAEWLQEAINQQILEPNAMTLATVDGQGRPSARIVLLKGFDADGFVFYTNYQSRKGEEIRLNPNAALVFFWAALERQVRVEGVIEKVDAPTSDRYFLSRPPGSQIGAAASPQSRVIPSRQVLDEAAKALAEKYGENGGLSRPEHWGGYVVKPQAIEFWQGRKSRLHDRIRYRLLPGGAWEKDRLAP